MGIKVEYNPDLALRNMSEFDNGIRKEEECIPEPLEKGKIYDFLKKEQRLFWLMGEIPLLETKGNQELSLPIASVVILEATHFLINREVWTKGRYKVVEVFKDKNPYFNGFAKI